MVKLPKEIKIGNRTVEVAVTKLDDTLMGRYNMDTFKIELNKNMTEPQMVETFWHELMHAIFDYNRVSIEIQTELQKEQNGQDADVWNLEERMAENFAKVFLQVIQDNNLLAVKS